MSREELLGHLHSETAEQVRHADSKAALILAGVLALLAAIATRSNDFLTTGKISLISLFTVLAGGLLILSAGLALVAVYPRRHPTGARLSWVSLSCKSRQDCVSYLKEADEDDLERELAEHIWELSSIAKTKYAWVSLSLQIATVAMIPALFTLWLGAPAETGKPQTVSVECRSTTTTDVPAGARSLNATTPN